MNYEWNFPIDLRPMRLLQKKNYKKQQYFHCMYSLSVAIIERWSKPATSFPRGESVGPEGKKITSVAGEPESYFTAQCTVPLGMQCLQSPPCSGPGPPHRPGHNIIARHRCCDGRRGGHGHSSCFGQSSLSDREAEGEGVVGRAR